jgi:hypothetical protein
MVIHWGYLGFVLYSLGLSIAVTGMIPSFAPQHDGPYRWPHKARIATIGGGTIFLLGLALISKNR